MTPAMQTHEGATLVLSGGRTQKRLGELRKQIKRGELQPVHPRDRHWFDIGRGGQSFTLEPPTHGGGSYYARYRAMHEAGAAAREASA